MTKLVNCPTVILDNVTVAFSGRTVLQKLNLTLSEQRIAVIGANGSGKSTFARLLNGLLQPTTGHVTVDGLDTVKDGKTVRRKTGFVFQNPDNQIVMPVVEEDLAFGLKNLKLPREEITQRIEDTLTHYNLTDIRYQATQRLSGGQKQLLAICGVLAMKPDLIVFDEPTTQLDLKNKRQIANVIDTLAQHVVVVTHDLPFIAAFDRVLVFNQGHLVCDDIPDKAITCYEELMT